MNENSPPLSFPLILVFDVGKSSPRVLRFSNYAGHVSSTKRDLSIKKNFFGARTRTSHYRSSLRNIFVHLFCGTNNKENYWSRSMASGFYGKKGKR